MAKPNQELIDTFIGITGLPDTLAIQILQEYGGDLNRAVNAHFNHGDRAIARGTSIVDPHNDFMDLDEPVLVDPPYVSTTGINPETRAQIFDSASLPTERRVIPIEMKNENGFPSQSGLLATVEDVSRRPQAPGSEANGTIVIDDDDNDEMDNVQSAQSVWDVRRTVPSAPVLSNVQDPDFDVEEEMIRAAIEASKKEAEGIYSSEQFGFHNGSEMNRSQLGAGDAHTASSSFEGALLSEHAGGREKTEMNSPVENEFPKSLSRNERLEAESSFIQDQPPHISENGTLSRQRARHLVSGLLDSSIDIGEGVGSLPSNPNLPQMQQNETGFPSDEWGGISSAEHDEAVMLEAAMFGGIPETSEYNAFTARRIMQNNLNANVGPYMMPEPRPPSPTLTAQRQLREQQDDEYFASLQADIEKAEARRLEEQAARYAAREEEKRKEEERLRKLEEEQELERQLAAKEASMPQEPSSDEGNAVNLLVRMPDGSRRGRRFLKSDKLKCLFDYIDIGGVVKPNTYRLVRPYPRRAFGDGDSILTLSELGLTSKQEALYLELV